MRVLPSGSHGLLLELADLGEVLAHHAALEQARPEGVLDVVPAARTILLALAPDADPAEVAARVRDLRPRPPGAAGREPVELPVRYDGEDLAEAARLLGIDPAELVRRHAGEEWTVAFCGFAPGFGYLTGARYAWSVPRRDTPRAAVPAGAVALAGEFTGVYPRRSPGGWQLIGTALTEVFDADRDPPALLVPGTPVRFVEQA
ncbi:5-oxoprolinase subunit B family protein [Ornithinicoccus halotolerans]|uniref:5-oxoprolinase subunit B family protein n=1 Tax=Ornithinicoccus halotolerans TaxID=1748220 RepID=UPI0012971AB9|nr:allophanate hydrolase subunit 1 [Ornithinicoccus halotolerans]